MEFNAVNPGWKLLNLLHLSEHPVCVFFCSILVCSRFCFWLFNFKLFSTLVNVSCVLFFCFFIWASNCFCLFLTKTVKTTLWRKCALWINLIDLNVTFSNSLLHYQSTFCQHPLKADRHSCENYSVHFLSWIYRCGSSGRITSDVEQLRHPSEADMSDVERTLKEEQNRTVTFWLPDSSWSQQSHAHCHWAWRSP